MVASNARSMPAVSPEQARRMRQLRRLFLNDLRRKPTAAEAAALDRAVRLSLRAELAAVDPHVCLDDVVRVDNAAARGARKAWARLIETRRVQVARASASPLSVMITRAREVRP
jgi:hypothetical protein